MRIKLFVKRSCPICPQAKALTEDLTSVEQYDMDQVNGLAEAAFYGVLATPSIIVTDDGGKELASWRGEVPSKADLIAQISQ